jgi:hypothetical protein
MAIPKDAKLYEKAKAEADKTYKKPSAYKSGFLVKKYKEMYKEKYGSGEPYEGKKTNEKGIGRWFLENWVSVGGEYPTYRPTKRINKDTPKTVSEIPKERLKEQIKLKQKIKGKNNLPKF